MIKYIAVAVSAALICASSHAASYKDGKYVGEGTGNASKIQVEVVVSGGKITSVKTLRHGETEMLLRAAEKNVSKAVVKNNGTEGVAAVTGASNSTKGIIEAVNKALAAAQ